MTFKRIAILITILLATAGLTNLASRSERIAPNRPFSEFPLEIGPWEGTTRKMDEKVYNILGVEDYIIADYRKASGELVNLYVGFYQSQKEGDIIHSPKNCMPGAGWNIAESSVVPVQLNTSGKSIKVIKLLLVKENQKQLVFYWFQSRGRIISSEYMQKIWLVVDSIMKNRTDGSFVRLITPIISGEKAGVKVLEKFTRDLYPVLNQYIPN